MILLKIQLVFILNCLIFSSNCLACFCAGSLEFSKIAPYSEFVALVKVTKYSKFISYDIDNPLPIAMEVEVIDVYKGNEKRKTITVWGDKGNLCRPFIGWFKLDSLYVIAFEKGIDAFTENANVHQDERSTDYAISICEEYYMSVDQKNQVAISYPSTTKKNIPLNEISGIVNNKNILFPIDFESIFKILFNSIKKRNKTLFTNSIYLNRIYILNFNQYLGNFNVNIKGIDLVISSKEYIERINLPFYFAIDNIIVSENYYSFDIRLINTSFSATYFFKRKNEIWELKNFKKNSK